jgi:aspartate carbamoyltransferase regulatory subunit
VKRLVVLRKVKVGIVVDHVEADLGDEMFELVWMDHSCQAVSAGHELGVAQLLTAHLIFDLLKPCL